METIYNMATFNVLMLLGIVVALLAIKRTAKLNKNLDAQKARDQVREDSLLNGGNRLAH